MKAEDTCTHPAVIVDHVVAVLAALALEVGHPAQDKEHIFDSQPQSVTPILHSQPQSVIPTLHGMAWHGMACTCCVPKYH